MVFFKITVGILMLTILLLVNGAGANDSYDFVLSIPSQQWNFSDPSGIAVDNHGNVYVVDDGNHRIQKFSSSGTFLTMWGSSGSDDSQFNDPEGVAVDNRGNVYVADTGNHRIQKFRPETFPSHLVPELSVLLLTLFGIFVLLIVSWKKKNKMELQINESQDYLKWIHCCTRHSF